MKRIWILLLLSLLVSVLAVAANGQQLENRHMVEVQLGAWNHNQGPRVAADFGNTRAELDINGLTGGISYGYFFSEDVSINFSVGMRSASVDAALTGFQSHLETATVVHVFSGIRYFLPHAGHGSAFRPYLMGDVGPVIGSQTWVGGWNSGKMRAETQTAFGARFGAGINFLLGSHLTSGVVAGYHLMSDFDEPIGGFNNYNGPMLAFSLGYLFGGDRNQSEKTYY